MPKAQKELEGMEPPSIREIENAAEAYVDVRDKRMKLTEKEVAAKETLIQAVLKHADAILPNGDGDRVYRYDDMVVILKAGKPNVKVRHDTGEEPPEEE